MPQKLLVVLVHGTWANDAKWVLPGSGFRSEIERSLGSSAEVTHFTWSGSNSHSARLKAASDLSRFVEGHCRSGGFSQYILIGHSHGGNVALYAISQISRVWDSGVVCLATPIVSAAPRVTWPLRFFSLGLASIVCALFVPFVLILAIYLAGAFISGFSPEIVLLVIAHLFATPTNSWVGFFSFALAVYYFLGCRPFLKWSFDSGVLGFVDEQTKKLAKKWVSSIDSEVPLLFLAYGVDEAFWGLRSTEFPIRVLSTIAIVALALCGGIGFFTIIASMLSQNWDILTLSVAPYPPLMPIVMLLLVFLLFGGLAFVVGILVGFAFLLFNLFYGVFIGHLSPIDHAFLRIRVMRFPESRSHLVEMKKLTPAYSNSRLLRLFELFPFVMGLVHSRIYSDAAAIEQVIQWIEMRQRNSSPKR